MIEQFFCNRTETKLNDDGSCPICGAVMIKTHVKDSIRKQNEQMLIDAGLES